MQGKTHYRLIRTNYNSPVIAIMTNKVCINKCQTKDTGLRRKKRFGIFTKKSEE